MYLSIPLKSGRLGQKTVQTSKKFVARRMFQEMLFTILLLTYWNPTYPQGMESYDFATILILPNFAIFRGFWFKVGHINVQVLGDK